MSFSTIKKLIPNSGCNLQDPPEDSLQQQLGTSRTLAVAIVPEKIFDSMGYSFHGDTRFVWCNQLSVLLHHIRSSSRNLGVEAATDRSNHLRGHSTKVRVPRVKAMSRHTTHIPTGAYSQSVVYLVIVVYDYVNAFNIFASS
jgi:hypothetical protein